MIKTIHHISPKVNDVFSFNCPRCGSCRMANIDPDFFNYWTCSNGHAFYVDLYESTAKTLNLCFKDVSEKLGGPHD